MVLEGRFRRELSDEAIALHVKHGALLPTDAVDLHVSYPIDGKASTVTKTATPWC